MIIDVNERRRGPVALHGLVNADRAYTIYYDETNNHRRVHVREDGLNVPEPNCFLIGGIAYEGAGRSFDLRPLRVSLRVQDNAPEIKLKHVATGGFLKILGNPKLEIFLTWLVEQGLYIHYSVVDPLYWGIVDIIDSILATDDGAHLISFERHLKNDLYTILRCDFDGMIDVFRRFSFPNVGEEHRLAFVEELIEVAEARSDLLEHFNYMMLRGVLQLGRKVKSLPFLEHESANVLIDGFGPFFLERIYLLKNAAHILDVEDVIRDYLNGMTFMDGTRELKHFRFAISHDEPGIQVSDTVAGLLGKYFSFICASDDEVLSDARGALSHQQKRNLNLLNDLLERSIAENPVFAHAIMSNRDRFMGEAFRERD